MGDFLQVLAQWIAEIWPFRIVRQWERGALYCFGRYWKILGPGCYPVIPWFMTVHEVSIVPEMVETGRQDITLQDGSILSFSASAWVQVVDVDKAVNTIDNYNETVKEIIRAVLADRLAMVDARRLEPDGRGRLLSDLRRWVDEECASYGMDVTKLRFTSFMHKVKAYRLLGDIWHT